LFYGNISIYIKNKYYILIALKKRILYILLGVMLLSNVGMGQTLTSNAVANRICSGDNLNITMTYNQKIYFFLEYNLNDGNGWIVFNNALAYNSPNSNPSIREITGISLPSVLIASSVDFRIRYSVGGSSYNSGTAITSGILLTITNNPLPNATVTVPSTICNGVEVDLGANPVLGSTYSWSSTSGSFSSTSSNPNVKPTITQTYRLTEIITATGCENFNDVVITVNQRPTATLTLSPSPIGKNPICLGEDVNLYLTVVSSGTWSMVLSDNSRAFEVNGPTTYSTTLRPYRPTSDITYSITSLSDANCSAIPSDLSGTVPITVKPLPIVSITKAETSGTMNDDAIICTGASITLSGAGATSYVWDNGITNNTNFIPSSTITYTVTGTDVNGCVNTASQLVIVNALPTVTITNPSAVCAPGTVDLTASAITAGSTLSTTYTYFTNASATTALTTPAAVAASGTYYIKGTSTASCIKVEPVEVIVNALPTVTITNPSAVCAPGTVDLTASAITAGSTLSTTYSYFTNASATTALTTPAAVAASGTYYIKGTSTASCIKVEPVEVIVNALPTVTITNPSAVCAPGTVDLTASAITVGSTLSTTYTYFTNASATTALTTPAAVAASGTYYIKGTSTASCIKVEPVEVIVNALPTLTITNPSAVCAPGTVDLTASTITAGSTASLTYSYFTNATATSTLTNTTLIGSSGTYYIKGTTASNCSAVNSVVISINPVPTFNVTSPSVCIGSPLKITANPLTGVTTDYDYTWVVPTGVTNPGNVSNFTTTIAGVYAATIKNKTTNCVSAPVNNTVSFYPLPTAAAIVATDNKLVVNKTLNLTAAASGGSSPYSISWTPNPTIYYTISGQENAVFTALKEGKVKFKYQVKDANSCEVSSVEYEITIDPADIILVLPNAFTPNGDNNNDEFKVAASNTLGKTSFKSLEIYNRNGKLMFRTEDITQGWNGRYDNVLQDMGVYFVKLVKLNKDGQLVVETSPIYLLK
jgi:gliding motility-associated-like protein